MDQRASAETTSAKDGLSRRARRGVGTTGGGQLARIVLQLASVIVLARLLSPADFGLVAMVTAVVGIAEVLRDFGLAPAAIQARTLTSASRSNLLWANVAIGLLAATVVAGAAPLLGGMYGDARIPVIALAIAPVFLINGVSAQYRASLLRELRFGASALADIIAQGCGLAVGIVAACLGAGYWAIVAQQLTQAVAGTVVLISVSNWLPRMYDRRTPLRPYFRYGLGLLGTQLLVYVSSNVDSVLIGTRFGATALGFYNRAFQMLVLPLNQISSPATRVALPVLSRLVDEPQRFSRFLLAGQATLAWVVLPVLAFGACQAPLMVGLLLGERWQNSAPVFAILAIGGAFQTLSYATYWVFLSSGKTASNFRFSLVSRSFMVVVLLVGSVVGVTGVAVAYSASLLVIWLAGLLWVRMATPLAPSGAMLKQGALVVLACLFGVAASAGAQFASRLLGSVASGLFGAAAFVAAMGLLIACAAPVRSSFVGAWQTVLPSRSGRPTERVSR